MYFLSNCKYSFDEFIDFLRNNLFLINITVFFLLLGYGIKLFSLSFSIDTEAIISITDSQYSAWHELGRTGLVLFKHLMGIGWYNNALASFLMVLFIGLSALVWAYLLNGGVKKNHSLLFFTIPVVSSPIIAEMLGFLLMGMEVALALIFIAISLMCTQNWIFSKSRIALLFAIIFSFIAFSIYLAMVTIFITATFFVVFTKIENNNRLNKETVFVTIRYVLVFLLSYLAYTIFNKGAQWYFDISTHPYISEQLRWGKDDIHIILSNLLNHLIEIYYSNSIFFTKWFLIVSIVFFLLLLIKTFYEKKSTYNLLIAICIVASPFMMGIILGNRTTERTIMTHPFALGFMLFYIYQHIQKQHKYLKGILVLTLSVIGLSQSYVVNRIFYTEAITYQQDVNLVYSVQNKIGELGFGEFPPYPVAFIGSHSVKCNNSCYSNQKLALTGRSLFEITFGNEHGTFVKNHFFAAQGASYNLPSSEQIQIATKVSENMPHWPSKGSIALVNDVIIVNF
ncbi:glucosyltransferase domain-containing protein [Haemophilus parainfluenzae]|uniref:Glucosyl transferase GtrII n=1 Tax=Haemophilus parainfluenzae TaxID=729 RepID=A0A377JIC4_HAEPA|nr:glucosyltransferase domain-containing protein [Haemophilus parainfluenzae]MBS6284392.1 glucosyltransferase domain-containing protein [Haemophilus parainfluenzae]STP05509.1 Uncharacterised protein [Haemophilus parainfluenzae]